MRERFGKCVVENNRGTIGVAWDAAVGSGINGGGGALGRRVG